MMLDATAGNRLMWPNRNPPHVIFMDREHRLRRPPDIIADNRYCPFRDDVFETVIYDPPHAARGHTQYGKFKYTDPTSRAYFGWNITKVELLSGLGRASKEFQRIAKRLCLKWAEVDWTLWQILPFFKNWKILQKKEHKSSLKRGKNITWWVTFIRSSASKVNET